MSGLGDRRGHPDPLTGAGVPEGMTPEKLRYIAKWLDIYDGMADQYIAVLEASGVVGPGEGERAQMAVRSKEVQGDLNAWADHLEAAHG